MAAYRSKGGKPRNRIRQFWKLLLGLAPMEQYMQSTATNTDNGATVGPMQAQEPSLSTPILDSYHLQCSTLLYKVFVQIMLTGELSLLVISGTPTAEELQEAWQGILNEYIDLVSSEKTRTILDVWKRLLYTQWKIALVDAAVYALKYNYDEHVAGCLAAVGYDYITHTDDREAYLRQIYGVETDAKFLVIQVTQLAAEYKALNGAGNAAEGGRTAAEYEKELAILSRFMGYRLDKQTLTLAEYGGIQNLYTEYNKSTKEHGGSTI